MTSSAQNVDLINRILADNEGYSYEQISKAATEYGDACEKLNEILSRLIVFYRQGMYCEIARIADETSFLDEYQTLVFTGAEEWRAMCRELGCEIKASVSVINGTEIQTFLMEYDMNRDLFERNRYLAYSNAPAQERLDVLYQLSAAFPENPIWARSIQRLERRRELEIEDYLKTITRTKSSYSKAHSILEELENPVRRTPAPQEIVKRLRHIVSVLNDDRLYEEFHDMVVEWTSAAADKSENDCVKYLGQYRAFSDRFSTKLDAFYGKLSPEEQIGLTEAVRESETIERRAELNSALRQREYELEQLLSAEASDIRVETALTRLIQASDAVGNTNPPQIAERAEAYLDQLRMKSRRRSTMWIGLTALVLGGFIAAVIAATYNSALHKKASEFAQELNVATEDYEAGENDAYARAEKLIERMRRSNPKLEEVAEAAAAVDRFEVIQQSEKDRVASFNSLVANIEELHASGKTAAPLVASLKKTARLAGELTRLNDLMREDNQLRVKSRDLAESTFSESLESLKNEFEALKSANLDDESAALKASQLLSALDRLATAGKNANVSNSLETARKTLASAVGAFARNMESASSSDAIVDAIGNVVKYRDVVGKTARRLDEEEQAKTADAAILLVDAAKSWNEFVAEYGGKSEEWENSDLQEKAQSFIQANERKLSFVPELAKAESYLESLNGAGTTASVSDTTAAILKEFEPYATPCWSLYHVENERYYYLLEELKYGDEKIVKYRPSFDGDPRNFNSDFMEEDDSVNPAIQYRIYSLLKSMAADSDFSRIDLIDLIRNQTTLVLNAKDEELDPVLKGVLLYKLLKGYSADPSLSGFNDWLAAFDAEKEFDVDVDFYKQGSSFDNLRALVKKITRDMTPEALEGILKSVDVEGAPQKLDLPRYEWVGAVDEENGLTSIVLKPIDLTDGTALFIARVDNGETTFVECGKIVGGKAKVDVVLDSTDRWIPVYARIVK